MPHQRQRSSNGPEPSPRNSARGSARSSATPAESFALFSDETSFFNTTFSLHRISPLFIGTETLTATRLEVLAGQLRDTLVGDVVRGVELGLDGPGSAAIGGAGALKRISLDWVDVDVVLGLSKQGLHLSIEYENASSAALLLPPRDLAPGEENFLHLPLLLLRMPAPLKAAVSDFLSSTFDCRISPLRLQNGDLVNSWESWIRDAGLPTSGALAKDAVLTLGFKLRQPTTSAENAEPEAGDPDGLGLKALDIIVPNQDLRRFLQAGQRLGVGQGHEQPFTAALAKYLQHHLALDLTHDRVRITRIACGGFVLSEGRVKIFAPPEGAADDSAYQTAIQRLLGDLVASVSLERFTNQDQDQW